MINFDTLEYTKGAEAIGIKREHAEYTAKKIAYIVKDINDASLTKSYFEEKLTSELQSLKQELTIRLGGIVMTCIGILGFILHK